MRLSPRWRRGKPRDARPSPGTQQSLGAQPGLGAQPPEPTAAAPGGRPAGTAHWRRLAPLPLTVRAIRPTIAVAMGVFEDGKRRPLIAGPDLRDRTAARRDAAGRPVSSAAASETGGGEVASAEPARGRISGLVVVRAEILPEPEPAAESQPVLPGESGPVPLVPLRPAPRVRASAAHRRSLMKAVDEYVGAPEPDATPYASSAWLRMVESYRPPWAGGAGAVAAPPIPQGEGSWSSEATAPPPRAPQASDAEAATPARPRASLAESRRRGLSGPPRRPSAPNPVSADPVSADIQPPGVQAGHAVQAGQAGESGDEAPLAAGRSGKDGAGLTQDPATVAVPAPGTAAQPAADAESTPPPVRPGAPTPTLGLAAPIDRPVRRRRDTPPASPPTPPASPLPLALDDSGEEKTQPSLQGAGGKAQEPAEPTEEFEDPTETPHPTAPRESAPVYRFVPGLRTSDQATAALRRPTPLPAQTPSAQSTARPPEAAEPLTHQPAQPPKPSQPQAEQQAKTQAQTQTQVTKPVVPVHPLRSPRMEPRDTVPQDILNAVRRTRGVDVSDVPIRRGPAVAQEARSLGARAFTRRAEVFLPAHEGRMDEPVARGLLAHELTHAAQQRTLGPALPAEASAAGRALESEAVAAERWARGLGGDPATGENAAAAAVSPSSWTAPWSSAPATGLSATGLQRQAVDVMTAAEPDAPASPGAAAVDAHRPAAAAPADAEMDEAREKLLDLSRRRSLDLDSPGDLEELTMRIYQGIHRRLRRDLVVDRERTGRLGETGPFGPAR